MINDLLHVPSFARLPDYMGMWSIEPSHAMALWQMAQRMDLQVHVEQPPEPIKSQVEKQAIPNGKSLAIIRMTGVLMKSQSSFGGTSTIQLRREIRAAAADPEIAGILLTVDSPGGTVSGTDDLAADVKAASLAKPVWAHAEDLMASAAYWVASQAGRITANSKTALVGSIGTIQVITDYSAAAEKEGIKVLVFSTGSLKGLGIPGTKITDEQARHVQGLIDAIQGSFDAAVQKGRGLSAKELAAVRHGGVLAAEAAKEAKLIDAIQPFSKTLAEMTQAAKDWAAGGARSQGVIPMLRQTLPTLAG